MCFNFVRAQPDVRHRHKLVARRIALRNQVFRVYVDIVLGIIVSFILLLVNQTFYIV
jgi:cell division protein FtsN